MTETRWVLRLQCNDFETRYYGIEEPLVFFQRVAGADVAVVALSPAGPEGESGMLKSRPR